MIRKGVFIVGAKRTPFGAFGGSFKNISPTELSVISTKAALAQANVQPEMIDSVYFGNVIQCGKDAAYLARHVALKCGARMDSTALTLNRLCGSGFESVVQGAKDIQLGHAHVSVCGGVENMSAAPLTMAGEKVRFGVNLGSNLTAEDALWSGLTDAHAGVPMGITAENLAEKYDITRAECDEFSILSQTRWAKAKEAGLFDAEMAPVEVSDRKKKVKVIDTDEHPRPESTLEKISQLKPVFKKDGVVTAANASGICDGAGSIILASEEAVNEHNLTPLARLVSFHTSGCDPNIMGIGPVPAIKKALDFAGIASIDDVDRVEVNEAFAAQYLAVEKELGLDPEKTNSHGGAISLGHPLGASGSRIVAHLANELALSQNQKYHVGSACIGGGQGIAIVLEAV